MNEERKAVLWVVQSALCALLGTFFFDYLWPAMSWPDTPLRYAPLAAIVATATALACSAISASGNRDFKFKLAVILFILLIFGFVASILSYVFYTPALLTFEIFIAAMSAVHFQTIDTMDQQIFQNPVALVISLLSMLVTVPVTALCFTLSWSAIIIPATLLIYAYLVARIAAEPVMFPELSAISISLLSISVILNLVGCGLAFFLYSSTLVTAITALAVAVQGYLITEIFCIDAHSRQSPQDLIIVVANAAAALGLAVVVGAARAASPHPEIWEIGGAVLIIVICFPISVHSIGNYRESDPHLAQPNPITVRVAMKITALVVVMLLQANSVAGSFFYRICLPKTTSPVPLSTCFLLLTALYILDNLRNNIARKIYIPIAVVFAILSVTIVGAGIYVYFNLRLAELMESIVSAFAISTCLTYYFIRTKLQKDESEQRPIQLQQQRIQQFFWGPIAPAA